MPGRSKGPPAASTSWARSTSTIVSRSRRLETSKDWMTTSSSASSIFRFSQRGHERLLEGQPDGVEVRRVLGLRVDADALAPGQLEHLVQGRDAEVAVVRRVVRAHAGQPLDGPQRAELLVGEVLGEPPGHRAAVDDLGGAPVGELGAVGDVGGAADLVLVAGDEDAVLGRDEVGLDVVGALADGELVGRDRVLGAVAGGAAVADHHRVGRQVGAGSRLRGGRDEEGGRGGGQGDGGGEAGLPRGHAPEPNERGRPGRERGVNVR